MKEASRRTAVGLFVLRFLKLLISIITLSVSAKYFGVGLEREIWILSFNFVTVLNLAIWGPLNETFRAKFIFLKTNEGEQSSLERTGSLLLFTLLVLVVVIILISIFSPFVVRIVAPSYTDVGHQQLSLMLKFLLGSVLLTQCTSLLSSILNTYNSFYTPEITGFVSAIANLILIVILSGYIGIYSLVVSTYVSLLLLLIVLVYQVKKKGIKLFAGGVSVHWQHVKPFIIYSLPFFIPYLIGQTNGLLEKSLANIIGDGTVAVLDYSRKIIDIIQSVVTSVLATVMVPILASKFSSKDTNGFQSEAKKYLQLILLFLALMVPFLIVSSNSICNILYNKGNIDAAQLSKISNLIAANSISMLSVFMYIILGLVLLSSEMGKRYAILGVVAQIVLILSNLLLYKKLGVYTFVCSTILAHTIASVFMFFSLPFSKRETGYIILKHLSVIIAVSAIAVYFNRFVYHPVNSFLDVIFNGSLILLTTFIIGSFLKIDEVENIRTVILRKVRK